MAPIHGSFAARNKGSIDQLSVSLYGMGYGVWRVFVEVDCTVMVPELKQYEGSWVIVETATGKGILEVFRGTKLPLDQLKDGYKAVPIGEYLSKLNSDEKNS